MTTNAALLCKLAHVLNTPAYGTPAAPEWMDEYAAPFPCRKCRDLGRTIHDHCHAAKHGNLSDLNDSEEDYDDGDDE